MAEVKEEFGNFSLDDCSYYRKIYTEVLVNQPIPESTNLVLSNFRMFGFPGVAQSV